MRFKKNTLFFFILFISLNLLGQGESTYITDITHYGVKEGLSHRAIRDMHEDSRGFIWLATQYGLNRFDGKNFQWFTKEKQGLPSNYIRSIFEDDKGWLWVIVNDDEKIWTDFIAPSELFVINIYSLEVRTAEEHLSTTLPFNVENLFEIKLDIKGHLIFMTDIDAFYILDDKNIFTKVEAKTLFSYDVTKDNTLVGLAFDTTEKVREIDMTGKILRSQNFPDGYVPGFAIDENQLVSNIKYKDEHLFYGSFNGDNSIFHMTTTGKTSFFDLPKNIPTLYHKGYTGQIEYDPRRKWFWVSEFESLLVFSLEDGLISDFSDYPFLSENIIYKILITKNITWISTDDGLFKVKLIPNPFTTYLKEDSENYSIQKSYSCRGILQIGEELFVNVTSSKSTHQINLTTNKVSRLFDIDSEDHIAYLFPKAVFEDKDKNLWFTGSNISKRNIETGKHTYYHQDSPYVHEVWSIYQDAEGGIWFGGSTGLGYLDTADNLIKAILLEEEFKDLNGQVIYDFLEISPTEVLLSTVGGIYVFNPLESKLIKRYWSKGSTGHYLPYSNTYHIHQDKNGIFWVATGGGGLIRWEQKGGKDIFEQFTIADGLSSNTIYGVYEDNEDNLWMSSDYGIIKFNKTTYNARAFLPEDGVNQEEFNRISHYKAPDGRLFFGGINGLTAFYPKEITDSAATLNIPLEIVELLQYSSKTDKIVDKTTDVLQTSTIILKPQDRFFDLKFALLNYENSAFIRYAYRIEGIDKDWNYISENNIRISGLPYGKYKLIIRGQSSNGQFSTHQIQLTIRILRPFYSRWWFILLSLMIIIVTVYTWFQWRTRQLKNHQIVLEQQVKERTQQIQKDKQVIEKQAEELKNLDELKSTFFANISHELRTPLTLMLAPIDAALKGNRLNNREFTFLQTAKQNGKQLLKLINSILDLTKLEAKKLELHLESVGLFPLTRRITSTFESYAQNNGIQLLFNYQAEKKLRLQLDINKFEIILNNLLSNAIKFTPPNGEVNVIIKDNFNNIQIIVSDTGRGIHPNDLPYIFDRYYQTKQPSAAAEGGTGIGLALCKELVQLLNGHVSVESELGKGTTFLVQIARIEAFDTMTPAISDKAIDEVLDFNFEKDENILAPTLSIKGRNLLLVEDNPVLRDFLKTLLNHHKVTVAGNGIEAMEILQKSQPDLIISDVMMPIMDGFQLLDKLKSDDQYRHIPILMLTARASMQDKLKALRIGVDDYMTKPFEQDELYARVDNLLSNSSERTKWLQEVEPDLDPTESIKDTENIKKAKPTPIISAANKSWLEDLEQIVETKLSSPNFNTNALADELLMSRTQLFRRLKKITGLSPSQYIQEARLKKAFELFESKTYDSVKAVSLSVGITHRNSFASQFKSRFGKLPSDCL